MPASYLRKMSAYILVAMLAVPGASAQAQKMSAVPAAITIPDATPIKLRLDENVSSTHGHAGDNLDFVVVKDLRVDGFTVIPAGTVAKGTVTAVKGKRFLGMGGEVSLKLDSVEMINGDRVNLRARLDVKGHSHTKIMAAAMVATGLIFLPATPIFLLMRGHESTIVKSTEITAQIDGATSVSSAGLLRSPDSSYGISEMMNYLPTRVCNGEGREGDMVNLVFVAQQEELQEAFARAGWVQTDGWNLVVIWHILRHLTNYKRVPMARFYLFGRVQDYSYALPDPDATISRRHHLRIWKTDYRLNGTPIWVAAAVQDVAIEIAKRGRLVNHRIDPSVDTERDFVGVDLTRTSAVSREEYLHSADPVFQAQTTSGETYYSDSRILLLDLHPATSNDTGVASQSFPAIGGTELPSQGPAESFH